MEYFIGAFNRLADKPFQTKSVEMMLDFARESEWIRGVDLHIHAHEIDEIDRSFDYVMARLRR